MSRWPPCPIPFADRLRSNVRGATMMEFALVAAPFITLLLMILECSLVFFAQGVLQTSADAAGRLILTGQAQQQSMTAAQFKTTVCKTLPAFLSCSKLMIDVRSAANFSSVDTARPAIQTDSNGNPTSILAYDLAKGGGIVIVRLMYVWPVATTPMGIGIGNMTPNSRLLLATTVSKAEYFS